MRLVDLTAIPIRAFTMMLVQKLMRAPEMLARLLVRAGIEGGIFAVSTLALLCLAIILHFFPGVLGRNVAEAAPLIGLAIMVPGLRNLVEYQAELLFGRGQMLLRALNLAVLAGVKAGSAHLAARPRRRHARAGAVAQPGLCRDLPGFGAAHLQRAAAAGEDDLSVRHNVPLRIHTVSILSISNAKAARAVCASARSSSTEAPSRAWIDMPCMTPVRYLAQCCTDRSAGKSPAA